MHESQSIFVSTWNKITKIENMIGDIVTSKICNVQVIALRNCSQTNMTYSKSKGRWVSLLTREFQMKYKFR